MKKAWFIITLLLIVGLPVSLSAQDEGEVLFQSCAACHSIGQGKLVGPDLANIDQRRSEEWLLKFIRSSQSMVDKGDKDAIALFDEYKIPMPDQDLTDAEMKEIIAYIVTQSPGREVVEETAQTGDTGVAEAGEAMQDTTPPAPPPPATIAGREIDKATEADVMMGAMLFTGEEEFSNGGLSCISCHNLNTDEIISGGALAKDLTDAYERFGAVGLGAYLKNPQFQPMTEAYDDDPLSEEEIYSLVVFLKSTSETSDEGENSYGGTLLLGGFIGAIGLIGTYSGLWFRRRKSTVNKEMFDRQVKSV